MNIAIYGYGNLGRGVEIAVNSTEDMTLYGVFTRRDPETVKTLLPDTKVFSSNDILSHKEKIDVLIICGGSATDLPKMTPELAKNFNVVDSFDTHASIPEHFDNVNNSAKSGKTTALISAGWDPGMFSLARLYSSCILENGKSYTFWGRGVSQGHSDAIRRIAGVKDAKQYTVPIESSVESVRRGENPELSTRQKHRRECYVVPEEGADLKRIEKEIKTMKNYFAEYDTDVNFISEEELLKNHSGIPHGGHVIHTGTTGIEKNHRHTIEYSLNLESNPEFTSSVLVAFARAIFKLHQRKEYGCFTVFDIPPRDLSPESPEELRKTLL